MKVASWDWTQANRIVTKNGQARARKAAKILADTIRAECPIGTTSRPMYKTGKYAGQPWTKRDGGSLKKSVRVVERRKEKYGFDLTQFTNISMYGNVRVYAGNYFAFYAAIVEFYKPFIRPISNFMKPIIKDILENG